MIKKILTLGFLRIIALIVLISGTVGSLYFVIKAGRNNNSVLLRALFVFWVVSPFVAFVVTDIISKHWSYLARKTLCWLILSVTLCSLGFYSGVIKLQTKPAFIFLVVPLISWLLIITGILITRKLSRNINDTSKY